MDQARVADELLRAAAGLSRWASAQAAIDAPSAMVRLLASVEESGPIRVGDLAAIDHTTQPAVTRQVGRLEAQGWVTRSADPDDARASLVAITDTGRATLAQARQARGRALARVLGDVDPQRLREATQLLDQLLQAARGATEKV